MSRLERVPPDRMDEEQRALRDDIAGGPRAAGPQAFALTATDGSLLGPFDAMLRSPQVGRALQGVGAAVRYGSSLPPRVREAAILLVAAHWDCAFERHAHEAVGRSIGFGDLDLAALEAGLVPGSSDEAERTALLFVLALLRGDVTDEEWVRLAPLLGEQAVFELTTLVGYYATLALQLRVFRVGVE